MTTTTETTEAKVADALLQREQEITLSGKVYKVAPPSMATLILVSECMAELPGELFAHSGEKDVNLTLEALRSARYSRPIGKAIATLILGAKRLRVDGNRTKWLRWLRPTSEIDRVTRAILEDYPPSELGGVFLQLMMHMEVGDFFALTAFLQGLRVTRPTRGADNNQTARGL